MKPIEKIKTPENGGEEYQEWNAIFANKINEIIDHLLQKEEKCEPHIETPADTVMEQIKDNLRLSSKIIYTPTDSSDWKAKLNDIFTAGNMMFGKIKQEEVEDLISSLVKEAEERGRKEERDGVIKFAKEILKKRITGESTKDLIEKFISEFSGQDSL